MTMKKRLLWAVMGLAAMSATSAIAADLGGLKDAPVYDTESERALMIRGRMLWIVPDAGISMGGVDINNGISISNEVVPELDISYFFRRNLAVELILGTTKHDLNARGSLHSYGDLGSVWLLPPTALLQYHFDLNSTIKPYIGAGVNYTFFYGEEAGAGLGSTGTLKIDNNWGWALQAGVDVHIAGPWYANLDVKKLWVNTDVTLNNSISAKVDVDPWIVGVGLGYKFDRSPAPLK